MKAPILFPRTFGARHIVLWNVDGIYGKEFYKIIPYHEDDVLPIVAQLNSTFGILQRELLGLANLGDGAIKFSADDVALFEIAAGVNSNQLRTPFEQLASRALLEIDQELAQADRRALDAVIFDAIGITSEERAEFYHATYRAARCSMSQGSAALHSCCSTQVLTRRRPRPACLAGEEV